MHNDAPQFPVVHRCPFHAGPPDGGVGIGDIIKVLQRSRYSVVDAAALPAGRKPVGGDRGFDKGPFVGAVRACGATPHVAPKATRGVIDGRTTRHPGYAISHRVRKRVEEIFGWLKTVGPPG